jgi:nicotinamidase-related amidase
MAIVSIPAGYYQQFDADYSLETPGQGYGGWQRSEIKIDTLHTAFVVMHAWDTGNQEEYAGWHRAVEYFPRAEKICREVFPPLLQAIRSADMNLFHVVGGGSYHRDHPGYRRAVELAGPEPDAVERVGSDPVYEELNRFRVEHVFPGGHNTGDIDRGFARVDFAPQARPEPEEGVAENGRQLAALCRAHGINHLIYMGFAINWCLLMSPGGMLDMRRYGVICSSIRQAVTAVENRETARTEAGKELALWRVALAFGFVFELDDILRMLKPRSARAKD